MAFGAPEPLGVTPDADGVNVAVFSAHATAIEFCLFDGDDEVRRFRLRGRTGDIFHDHIPGVGVGARYGLRAHGPFQPSEGHRFNPAKLLIDPHAQALDRRLSLHPSMFGHRGADQRSFDDTDSGPFVPKAIVTMPDRLDAPATPLTPWARTILYELHVRGFTARHPAIPPGMRGRFAGLGHRAAIEHLVGLGVTTVELMPCAAWIEERHLAALGLRNYWGYNPIAFMAPDPYLAPGGWVEVREAVAALAAAGIETIIDVVLNHSGEGDVLGPTLSLRGLDNATYYRSPPDAPGRLVDDTGCGNSLALDRSAVLRLAMDALRAWALQAGVHGFRFDLATTLGRRQDGFDPAAPLLSAIAQDPVLRNLKLIAEPWDVGPGGYQAGRFPAAWGEWNDRFRDDVRRFWRGDPGMLGALATRLAGSSDLFGRRGVASRSVNFVVAHDGFTLADLVSYSHKRNAANGEANRDGTDANFSWNNGVEGPTDDPTIRAARLRDQRALLATLLLARGTPMIAMGAELGQSQQGNNNAYAQDNATAWLNWDQADAGLCAWVRRLTGIRQAHPLLRGDSFLTGAAVDDSLYPDVLWTGADGVALGPAEWDAPDATTLVMTLAGPVDGRAERVAVILHRGQRETPVHLPAPRSGCVWRALAHSSQDDGVDDLPDAVIAVAPRSVVVAVETAGMSRARGDASLLHRLANAAGIAPIWWDVEGRRTDVTDDTQRALLRSMRFDVGTEGAVRDSLHRLALERDRRPLPQTLTVRGTQPAMLPVPLEPGVGPRSFWLIVARENGEVTTHRIAATDGDVVDSIGIDGRSLRVWHVALPAVPLGRHRIWRDDRPDCICHVTVAPERCFLPQVLLRGGRRFGVGVQLYALPRAGDQGIGDFTTLAHLAAAARKAGAATVGMNPLHMLFPNQRDRASPYHPSDRRFLDPIYLDVPEAGVADSGQGLIDYPGTWDRKRAALEARFAALPPGGPAWSDLQTFVAAGGAALHRFATFQAIAEVYPDRPWQQWPDGLRESSSPAVQSFAQRNHRRILFHQYLQFLADTQLAAAARTGLELGLFRDLAVGAAPDGTEAWSMAHELADGAWIGAPPDPFAAAGQNWHLPPPVPLAMQANGFASFAGLIAANARHAGILRIDHAMGLQRLFWIPDGGSGVDGAYVDYPLQGLLGELALESARAGCSVIGEDLGTVPDGFRAIMSANGLLGYRVLLLERDGQAFRSPATYPVSALACVTTHDLPPMAGWLDGADIQERAGIGLLDPVADAKAARHAERKHLEDALQRWGFLAEAPDGARPTASLVTAVHAAVASSPSLLVMVQADDLAGARMSVNVPGTDRERPNWRRKVPIAAESLISSDSAAPVLRAVRAAGRSAPDETGGDPATEDVNPRVVD